MNTNLVIKVFTFVRVQNKFDLKRIKDISGVSALQLFQLFRYGALLFVGIVLAKSSLSTADIGSYETFMLFTGAVSFFWVNGLMKAILPNVDSDDDETLRVRFFNSFLLLQLFSVIAGLFVIVVASVGGMTIVPDNSFNFSCLIALYVLLNSPTILIEYIYLLKKQHSRIVASGIIFAVLIVLAVGLPAFFGQSIMVSIFGLIIVSTVRIAWLAVLLIKNGKWELDTEFQKQNLKQGTPLIFSFLLSGSAQYIDGIIVSWRFDEATLAVFRYGAREFPIAFLMANALSNSLLPTLGVKEKLAESLQILKRETHKLIVLLFPLSIIAMICSHWLFPIVFNKAFEQSATIFNIYILLIISRMLFPQTILNGLNRNFPILKASFYELIINVSLSVWFAFVWGIEGVAYGTLVAYLYEKIYLIVVCKRNEGIAISDYLPVKSFTLLTILLLFTFIVVEFIF